VHVDWTGLFADRKWRVLTELTGTTGRRGWAITFDRGKFEIDGGVFHSPLSSARGRKGVLLQEVGLGGEDIPGSRIPVGEIVYRKARQAGAVVS
jgi:hypothetical protein